MNFQFALFALASKDGFCTACVGEGTHIEEEEMDLLVPVLVVFEEAALLVALRASAKNT